MSEETKENVTLHPSPKSLCKECKSLVGDGDAGFLCDLCETWVHSKCIGIPTSLYWLISKNESKHLKILCSECEDICFISRPDHHPPIPIISTDAPCPSVQEDKTAILQKPKSRPPSAKTTACFTTTPSLKVLESLIAQQSSTLAGTKQGLQDLCDSVASLTLQVSHIETMCNTSLPLPMAADRTIELSHHLIEDAATKQADAQSRACNVLVRGLKYSGEDPLETANLLLSAITNLHPNMKARKATWFYRKSPEEPRPLKITMDSPSQRTVFLQSKQLVRDLFPEASVHPDLPVHLRPSAPQNHPPTPKSLSVTIEPSATVNIPGCTSVPTPTLDCDESINDKPQMRKHQRSPSFLNLSVIRESPSDALVQPNTEPSCNTPTPIPSQSSAVSKNGAASGSNPAPRPAGKQRRNQMTQTRKLRPNPLNTALKETKAPSRPKKQQHGSPPPSQLQQHPLL